MNTLAAMPQSKRLVAATPFLVVAFVAIVAGGAVAAASAHAPNQRLVWMVAYLVLVVGVAQAILGGGQALLAHGLPSGRTRVAQCLLFNTGNAGVVVGTMSSALSLVWVGILLFVAALVMFLLATRVANKGWQLYVYRMILLLVGTGAIIGLVMASTHVMS
ncbi:MAG: hypothetical protein ABI268_08410 [Rhodanobacter sp.]